MLSYDCLLITFKHEPLRPELTNLCQSRLFVTDAHFHTSKSVFLLDETLTFDLVTLALDQLERIINSNHMFKYQDPIIRSL